MFNNIEVIKSMANMLSKTLGQFAQITVSDTATYLLVENALDDSLVAGSPIGDNERYFCEDEDLRQLPFVVNYKSLSPKMNKLRSSTFFFKDAQGNIEYMLGLTVNVDEFIYLREIIDIFTNGGTENPAAHTKTVDKIPKLNLSMHDLIDTVIAEGQRRYKTTTSRMTKVEKQSLIREMHSRGAFLIKGAVAEAAVKLEYSDASVYRFIKQLEEK